MSNDVEVRWDRLTAPELRDAVRDRTVVIVPLGATEQHGPHLPVQVDWRSAYEISLRAARLMAGRQRALVTPAIPFGMSEHHMSLGGTLTLDYRTMAGIVGCVVRSAARHGFQRIFVLNGHGGNIAALEVMLTELTIELELPLAGGTYWHIAAKSIREILEHQPQLIHACEAETSILQALSPELVKPLDKSMRGALARGCRRSTGSIPAFSGGSI
jgi:creatinine amidohydrolase